MAQARSTKERCNRSAAGGSDYCHTHRHLAKKAMDVNPTRTREQLYRARAAIESARQLGTELWDLEDPLSTLRGLRDLALERAEQRDCGLFRQEALQLFKEVKEAETAADAAKALTELGGFLSRGAAEWQALAEVRKATREYAMRLERAWAIRLAGRQSMNEADVAGVITGIYNLILDTVELDQATELIQRIDQELRDEGAPGGELPAGADDRSAVR